MPYRIHLAGMLMQLAQGGTAVGTGLNAPVGSPSRWRQDRRHHRTEAFTSAPNKFEALAAHDAMVFSHGAMNTVAASLFKIANDIRLPWQPAPAQAWANWPYQRTSPGRPSCPAR